MSQRDRALQRDWRMGPAPVVHGDDAATISSYVASSDLYRQAAFELARCAPGVAIRKLAAGIKTQTRAAKVSVVVQLIRLLEEVEHGITSDIAHELGQEG